MTLLIGFLLPLIVGWTPECSAQTASPAPTDWEEDEPDTVMQNLRAFAKLYGYVRYFHPGDAAANTDWERFAIHGIRHVQEASTRTELRTQLDSLFSPIAPTVALYNSDDPPPLLLINSRPRTRPASTSWLGSIRASDSAIAARTAASVSTVKQKPPTVQGSER